MRSLVAQTVTPPAFNLADSEESLTPQEEGLPAAGERTVQQRYVADGAQGLGHERGQRPEPSPLAGRQDRRGQGRHDACRTARGPMP